MYGLVVTFTGFGDAVFRTFQLGLQFREILVGTELRIVFRHGQQLSEGGAHGTLGFLIFGQLFCGQVRRVHGDLRGFATGGYHGFQRTAFVRGIAFYGTHQVRNQVGPALVLRFHVTPGCRHSFVFLYHLVV